MPKHTQKQVDELMDYARRCENTPIVEHRGSTTIVYRGRVQATTDQPSDLRRLKPYPAPECPDRGESDPATMLGWAMVAAAFAAFAGVIILLALTAAH
jgi:hypothetical protein